MQVLISRLSACVFNLSNTIFLLPWLTSAFFDEAARSRNLIDQESLIESGRVRFGKEARTKPMFFTFLLPLWSYTDVHHA